jgi:hypothetical protein
VPEWGPSDAAAEVGNLMIEDPGLDPGTRQAGLSEAQVAARGLGEGIAQWSHGGRWNALVSWAGIHNRNPRALDTQVDFTVHEMRTSPSEMGTIEKVKAAHSLAAKTIAFGGSYERPGRPAWSARTDKAHQALNAYNKHS